MLQKMHWNKKFLETDYLRRAIGELFRLIE